VGPGGGRTMQGAGAGARATGAEGEGVGDLALSGSVIGRAVPLISLAAQSGDTHVQAVSIDDGGPGAGAHHVNAPGQPAHQPPAHSQQGPVGALVHSHNQHQVMQMLAHHQMKMLLQMHPALAHAHAHAAFLGQQSAAFAGAQPGASSTGAQQGGPHASAQAVSLLSFGFNTECMATHRLLRCAATPLGRAAAWSA